MGKKYIRQRGNLATPEIKPTKFICNQCGFEALRKDLIKTHILKECKNRGDN